MQFKCLFVGDFHCGHVGGLLPPAFVDSHDHEVTQTPVQKYSWQCWTNFCERAKKYKPDIIVVNGDVVDGKQRRQDAEESVLNLPADQEEACVQVLRFLRNACPQARWVFIAGTEYHDDRSQRSLENVASRMEAEKYPGVGSGRYSHEVLDMNLDGVEINVAHHIAGSGGIYRATALDRELIWAALAGKEGKAPRQDIVIRSHVHHYVHVEHASKHGFVLPCWQDQTRFMRHRSVYKMMPDWGGLFLTVDSELKKKGEDPLCHIEKVLYKLPERKQYKLTL